MTELEQLENEAYEDNVEIVDYHFYSNRIKGLYCDGSVALSSKIKTDTERKCILAEELSHYHTTVGNILDQSNDENRKQELRARMWAYDKLIGLRGIVNSYANGCNSEHEIAEYLEVTEEFLREAIKHYKNKYGIYAKLDNYVIYFEPYLGVLKLI